MRPDFTGQLRNLRLHNGLGNFLVVLVFSGGNGAGNHYTDQRQATSDQRDNNSFSNFYSPPHLLIYIEAGGSAVSKIFKTCVTDDKIISHGNISRLNTSTGGG